MACFRFTKRFLVVLFVLLAVNSANILTFPDSVETGSASYSPSNSGSSISVGSCTNTLVTLTIPFISDKGTNAYDPTLAFQALDLSVQNRTLSIRMRVDLRSSNSLTVLVDNFCSRLLTSITIRYLIVVAPLTSSVSLRDFDQDFSPSILLRSQLNFRLLAKSVFVTANQTNTALFLRGFNINSISSNFIDIYTRQTLTDTTLTVNITTGNANAETYLSQISFTVVMVNKQITLGNITSTFEIGTKLDTYGGYYMKQYRGNNTFGNNTALIGIRAFKNLASNTALNFSFTINNSVTFRVDIGPNTHPDAIAFDIINFVFEKPLCNSSAYMLAANSTCYATCPSPYFNNDANKTCDTCSSNCSSCANSPSNCTACNSSFYLNTSTCASCPTECANCSAPTNCSTCIDHYIQVNGSCVVNCSSIENCSFCTLNGVDPYCLNCSQGYSAAAGSCKAVCGDGVILGSEGCDDGNLNEGDGCSFQCTIQAYFVCNSSNGGNSTCFLKQLSLSYSYSLKVTDSNTFISYYSIQPKISALATLNWMAGVSSSNDSINIVGCSYDSSKGLLAVTCAYSDDVSLPVSLSFQFANMSNVTKNISQTTITSYIETENNLGLQYYSSSTYSFSMFFKYFAILLSCASILMFLAGCFGGKLIALEHLAVLQVTFLSIGTVHNSSPLFEALRYLRLSVGSTMLEDYDYSTSISRELKGWYFSPSLLDSYNIALGITLLPVLIAGLIKLLSLTVNKASKNLPKIWPIVLCEITFYGLIFAAYMVFSQLSFHFLLLVSGNGPQYVGLVVVLGQSLQLFVYCYYLNQVPTYFGDFKRKFEKFNICSYYYNFIVLERLLVSMLAVFLRNVSFGLILVFLVIVVQLIFVAQRKPYVCGGSTRPAVNLLATGLIVFLVFLCNILPSVSFLQTFVPIIICLILGIILGSSTYFLVVQLKEIYTFHETAFQDDKQIQNGNDTSVMMGKFFNISEPENLDQKNRAQFEIFKQKLILDADEVIIAPKQKTNFEKEEALEKEKLNYEWDNYHVVAFHPPILHQMKLKVRQKHIPDNEKPTTEL